MTIDKLVKVYTGASIVDAGLFQDLLQQHDIPTQMRNYHTSSVIGELPFVETYPEIYVPASYAQQAKRLLAELNEPRGNGLDWQCRNCEEENPSSFDMCWQCATPNEA